MIKAETPADYTVIRQIVTAAFGRDKEANLIEELRKLTQFSSELSLIGLTNGIPVGHILFFPVEVVNDAGESHEVLSLCPMAVLPEFQRLGIGSMMVREGLKIVARMKYNGVIVQCNGDYYPRFGFLPAEIFGIRYPRPVRTGTFLALELAEGSLAGCSGTVKYHEAFGIQAAPQDKQ